MKDIGFEECALQQIQQRYQRLVDDQWRVFHVRTCIDPKQALKDAKANGPVYTLVDYGLVHSLS